jgi:hypothetical protein
MQRPCHAINVFVPLVDLHARNGPTEFCLGSHILGFEDYDNDTVYVPTVPAGTPVIFDYRLGHRGLANTSEHCRPIVYCTYAAAKDGKEFRDSVNFSRKRYHRIGHLVEKPLSRSERTKKRRLAKEEQNQQKLAEEATVNPETGTDDSQVVDAHTASNEQLRVESGPKTDRVSSAEDTPIASARYASTFNAYSDVYAAAIESVLPFATGNVSNSTSVTATSMEAGKTAPTTTSASDAVANVGPVEDS